MDRKMRLYQKHPRRIDIYLLLFLAVVLFLLGIFAPVITFEKLIFQKNTFSIFSGIISFFTYGQIALGIIVFLFSLVFPVLKFIALITIWFGKFEQRHSNRYLNMLKVLGRWSMLDVFVILITVGSLRLGIIGNATIRIGIYYFAAAILLSIVISLLMGHLIPEPEDAVTYYLRNLRNRWVPFVLSLFGLVFFILGVILPLLHVEKWAFWDSHYSLLTGSVRFLENGQLLLGTSLLLFVVILPFLQFLSVVVLYLLFYFDWNEPNLLNVFLFFDEWAMVDVFALALIVFVFKTNTDLTVHLRSGFWFLIISSVISLILSFLMAMIPAFSMENNTPDPVG